MANGEQLKLLKRGTVEWNQWRGTHPDVEIDLSAADLSDAPLVNAHLHEVNLRGARLARADLNDAVLRYADLSLVDLTDAQLARADLVGAVLIEADLRGARFSDAQFRWTYVTNALADAQTFADADTSGLIGFKTIKYLAPGVASPSLVDIPIIPEGIIFISYVHEDSEFVDHLKESLASAGFEAWVDRSHLEGGQHFLRIIQEAIDRCALMLVVLSPDAVESDYVAGEYHYARQNKKVVIPLDYRICKVPMMLSILHIVDFRTIPYDQSVQLLVQAIQHHLGA